MKWQRLGTVDRRVAYAAVGADLTSDWSARLNHAGFTPPRVLQPGDPDASFGRWSPSMPPRSVPHVPRAFFVFGARSGASAT